MLIAVMLSTAEARAQTTTFEYEALILHPPGLRNSQAIRINRSTHEVVGGSWTRELGDGQALLWTGAGTQVVSLNPGSTSASVANGIFDRQIGGTISAAVATPHSLQATAWDAYTHASTSLHPANMSESAIYDNGGGKFVGWTGGQPTSYVQHAMLWTSGEANSVVDLNPMQLSFVDSVANAIDQDGQQQVGSGHVFLGIEGNTVKYSGQRAILWRGTAASAVDLHPSGFDSSQAHGVAGSIQAGYGIPTGGQNFHALMWAGSAGSAVDLNPAGFTESAASGVGFGAVVGGGWGLVAMPTPVTITATYRGVSISSTLTVIPPQVSSITFSPGKVLCGQSSTATVILNAQAPAGGASVQLAGSTGAATLPASVTIPEYMDRVSFTVRINGTGTTPNNISGTDTVTATYQNSSRQAKLQCKG
jgi:hypothetical protein